MTDFKPTASQAQAINSRGSAVLVSAGAGSGKTRVLTERLMARLNSEEDPVDIDRFLIITFTRAAAAELRGRIMEEISAALAADPGNRRLRRQSALCRRAQIGTIHSFCASILRENCQLADLSPDFKIADEDRSAAMKAAALERTLENCYAQPERCPGFLELADTVGAGRDDSRLSALVLNLHEKMQCHAWPEDWAQRQVRLLSEPVSDAAETPWGREILARAGGSVSFWRKKMDACLGEMRAEARIAAAYGASIAETADALRDLELRIGIGWDSARDALPIPFPKLKALRNSPDPELSERIKAVREDCRKAMGSLESMLSDPSGKLLDEMRRTQPAMSALLDLEQAFDREYARDKLRAGLVDYADLEHMTARLLTDRDGRPTELAGQIAGRYDEIMVDEYQDVSRVQDSIFHAVSKEGRNLFLVGDVKQSIYRFRLADPALFTEKYLRFADAETAAPSEPRRILLRENFRSRPEILKGANAVFSLCMSRELGELDYDENAALIPGARFEGPGQPPRLMILRLPDTGDAEERPDRSALEARMVAGEIRRLLDAGTTVSEHGSQRPLRCSDIAILLRSPGPVGGIYRRALAQEGIPVASGQGGSFFSSAEISTLLSLLAVLDNPHQDIPLISVLSSPAFGCSADDLSLIRAALPEGDIFSALAAAARFDPRFEQMLACLNDLRSTAPDLPASELVWTLIFRLDLLALCSAMSDGEQRRARLMEMLSLAWRFEQSGSRGLHRFVLWLRRLAERGQEPSLGTGTASAVQILSVHRSKGLEFPVVFLCDTARRFNRQDSMDTVLVHPQLGLGPKLTDTERRVEYPTLARSAVRLRLEREMLSEEMRLLYVAMTRPKERLYITAALRKPEARIDRLRGSLSVPMTPEQLASASSPVDWLLSAALADGGRCLDLSICESEDAAGHDTGEKRGAEQTDPALAERLEQMLGYVYPYEASVLLPSKLTATGLKGRFEPDSEAQELLPAPRRPFRMPDFSGKEAPLTGAEKGTATHLVLQRMDLARGICPEEVRDEIERLRGLGFLNDREAKSVDAGAVSRLLASPLGGRMRAASELRREFRFSLLCPADSLLSGPGDEEILLQGAVDCFFEEKGELVIVDYKTDRLASPEDAEKKAAFYLPQLRAYAEALRRITGKRVREGVLYFLSAGESVSLKGSVLGEGTASSPV